MNDTRNVNSTSTLADPTRLMVVPVNEIPFAPRWGMAKRRKPSDPKRNAALRALIDAAMDQPNPSPALVVALAGLAKL